MLSLDVFCWLVPGEIILKCQLMFPAAVPPPHVLKFPPNLQVSYSPFGAKLENFVLVVTLTTNIQIEDLDEARKNRYLHNKHACKSINVICIGSLFPQWIERMAMEKYWDPILQCRTFAWLITVCGCAAILLLADHNSPFTININAVSSASVSSRGRSAPWSLSSCNCDVHINCFMSIGALDFEMDHSIIERESGEKKNSKEHYHQYLFQTKSRSGRCLVFSINDGVVCIWTIWRCEMWL